MDEDSRYTGAVKLALGAVGLGAVASVFALPKPYGLWVGLAILGLFFLLFGVYFLVRRLRARRQRERFSSAIEAQTAAAPKTISGANERASLDKLRQKFQMGLQEFKSRGKDIYKLPWYAIIGEPGSGKTEAIRHSDIGFPPGLNEEHKGTGGTVNMDWWFTNQGIILDTAGSMIFREAGAGEAPEWREFLRLLRRSRTHSPINGLFLVLSIESLIRDSTDMIAQKASKLAQQLDLIQRTLDVRFPVYLLVTKSDLLTGFREFFDSIDDPQLQSQIFGWSNPDPLDSHFRPDLVDQHLKSVAARLRRRRLALLRENAPSASQGDTTRFSREALQTARGANKQLDQVDSLFALPESLMLLAPRLRRYLEMIFVAGEWSAKPVFLRGIYFTSSMREGKALDEAIALATGLSLDQLPEDRSWDKNRAYFLRDLFLEKVFRESGLVTRATNTLRMLRQRQLIIFGSAGAALLLALTFAGFAYTKLKRSVGLEAAYWKAGSNNWTAGVWSPAIITPDSMGASSSFVYGGANPVSTDKGSVTAVEFHQKLKELAEKQLSVPLIFWPMRVFGFGEVKNRDTAQRTVFEGGVLGPLVRRTRERMQSEVLPVEDVAAITRHREALLSLIQLEADGLTRRSKEHGLGGTNSLQKADKYLRSFLSYLTDAPHSPDTNLVAIFAWTYSEKGSGPGKWPSETLWKETRLADNPALQGGLNNFRRANQLAVTSISNEVQILNALVEKLGQFQVAETQWLQSSDDLCAQMTAGMSPIKQDVDRSFGALLTPGNYLREPVTNLAERYVSLEHGATSTSANAFKNITTQLPEELRSKGIIFQISTQLNSFAREAGGVVKASYEPRRMAVASLDANYVMPSGGRTAYLARWTLYEEACAISRSLSVAEEADIAREWARFLELVHRADRFTTNLTAYNGPMSREVATVGSRLTEMLANAKQVALRRINKDIQTRLGFPVALDADPARPMKVQDLKQLNTLFGGMAVELAKTVWQTDKTKALSELEASCKRYTAVVNALVNENGTPIEYEFKFLPPDAARADDRTIVTVFRNARITVAGKESPWKDLAQAREPVSFGVATVDADLTIAFRRLLSDTSPEMRPAQFAAWGLPSLIRDSNFKPVCLDDGQRWRFSVRLEDTQQSLSGNAVFEAVLKGKLPKPEDWPKSK